MYSPLFPMVRLGLLLFAVFSLEKEKGGGRAGETARSATQKIREGKGFSAKAEASSK